ncbi:MAG: hypothetical protein ACRD17_03145, partial [Terriglobales bacterium]
MLLSAVLACSGIYVLAHSTWRSREWPGWLVTLNLLMIVDVEAVVLVFSFLQRAYWLTYLALAPELWAFVRFGLRLVRAQRVHDRAALQRRWLLYGGNIAV